MFILILCFLLSGCTYSVVVSAEQGSGADAVDETASNEVNPNLDISR